MSTNLKKDTALYYLHEIFIRWTLSGQIKRDPHSNMILQTAFYSILGHQKTWLGKPPEKTIQDWIEDSVNAAFQTGLFKTREQCNNMRFPVTKPSRLMPVELSLQLIWTHWHRINESPYDRLTTLELESIRSTISQIVGKQRQQELIKTFEDGLKGVVTITSLYNFFLFKEGNQNT